MTLHSRVQRINEELKLHVARVIDSELKDPRIGETMVTVTEVKTSKDLHHAEVYVSVLADEETSREIVKVLEHSSGFIRSAVAEKVTFRFMPKLHFVLDETIRTAARIQTLLKKIEREQEAHAQDAETQPESDETE